MLNTVQPIFSGERKTNENILYYYHNISKAVVCYMVLLICLSFWLILTRKNIYFISNFLQNVLDPLSAL